MESALPMQLAARAESRCGCDAVSSPTSKRDFHRDISPNLTTKRVIPPLRLARCYLKRAESACICLGMPGLLFFPRKSRAPASLLVPKCVLSALEIPRIVRPIEVVFVGSSEVEQGSYGCGESAEMLASLS